MDPVKWIVFCLIALGHVNGDYSDGFITLVQQMSSLNEEVRQLNLDVPRLEDRLYNHMELSEITLKKDLKDNVIPNIVKSQVRDFVTSLLKDKSLESMINRQVASEFSDLKLRQNLLKTQHRHMTQELDRLKRKTSACNASVIKTYCRKYDKLELKTDILLGALNDTDNNVEELMGNNADLSAEVNELFDENASFRRNQTIFKYKLETSENNVRNLSTVIEHLTGDFEESEQRLEGYEGTLSNLSVNYSELVDHTKDVKVKVEIMEDKHADLKIQLDELNQTREMDKLILRNITSEITQHVQANTDKMKQLDNDVDNFVDVFNDTVEMVWELKGNCSELKVSFAELLDENVSFRRNQTFFGFKLETSEKTFRNLSTVIEHLTGDFQVSDQRLKRLAGILPNLSVKYSELVDHTKDVEEKVEDVKDGHASLKRKLDKLNQTHEMDELILRNITSEITQHVQANTNMMKQLDYGMNHHLKQNMSRLLVVGRYSNQHFSLRIHDGQRSSFSLLSRSDIRALEYDSLRETILFSTNRSIYSLTFDGTESLLISTNNYIVSGMRVDRNHLFIIAERRLGVINMYSNNVRTLARIAYHSIHQRIALDTKKKIIYFSNYRKLQSIDYDGRNQKVLDSGYNVNGIALDLENDILYYLYGYYVRSLLSGRHKGRNTRIPRGFHTDLRYYNNTLYIGGTNIYSLDTDTNAVKTIETSISLYSSICLLP